MNNDYTVNLYKSKFESLNENDFKCSLDPYFGPQRSKHLEIGLKMIEKYNCTLPWMSPMEFPNVSACEVNSIPNSDNEHPSNYEYLSPFHFVSEWGYFKAKAPVKDYEDLLPCNRTVYNSYIEYKPRYSGNRSSVIIQYVNPYVQIIKDSHSYDMQSLVGEVGGTLGLLLGFSFMSIFDLIQQVFHVCSKRK